MTEIAKQLKAAREARGQTQEQAAGEIGVSFTTVSRWENEHVTPQGLQLRAVEAYIRKAKVPQQRLQQQLRRMGEQRAMDAKAKEA